MSRSRNAFCCRSCELLSRVRVAPVASPVSALWIVAAKFAVGLAVSRFVLPLTFPPSAAHGPLD
jgi:hypothetical protein